MLNKFLDALETPKHPLLGPNLWILKLVGLIQPEFGLRKYMYNIMHIAAILFVVSQYVELYLIRSDLDSALKNLSISMLSTVCVIKAGTCAFRNKSWKEVLKRISSLELKLMAKNDSTTNLVMTEYKKYSRIVTYFYWTLVSMTVMTVILSPLATFISSAENREKIRNHEMPYPEIMSSWLPFDKTRSKGYVLYVLEHALICFYGGGIVASYDSSAVVVMNFFAGQLKLLRLDCERIFQKDDITIANDENALANIRECHERHIEIIENAKLFNSLLSPVLFVYIIVCSVMLCASAIQITMEGITPMQQMWIAEYLISLIAQLFLYCWHSNEVFVMSKEVAYGVYESDWWTRGVRLRRCILLLGGQLQKSIIFTAGPFTTLTVATFVAILKGSYSYYAILSKNGE